MNHRGKILVLPHRGRDGIALILVLGFLSVLTIMAVSFAINMRTERLTSRMYLDGVRSRHFIDVALARALSDIDYDLESAGNLYAPNWPNEFFSSRASPGMPATNLLIGQVTNYLPRSAVPPVQIPPAGYVEIRNPINDRLMGRYAYLVMNLTGLLDVNLVGDTATPRNLGRVPGEIRVPGGTILSDVAANQWGNFRTALKNQWRRIDTLWELTALSRDGSVKNFLTANLGVRHFLPFSRSITELNPQGEPKINLGRSVSDLMADKSTIVDTLVNDCGIENTHGEGVFNSIIDFCSPGLVPVDPDGLSGKPVPMINEIVASGQFTRSGPDGFGNYEYKLENFKISVETWYPFAFSQPETFSIGEDAKFQFTTAPPGVSAAYRDLLNGLNPTNGNPTPAFQLRGGQSGSSFTVDQRGFHVVEFIYPTRSVVTNLSPALPGLVVQIEVDEVAVIYQGNVVDRVRKPRSFNLQMPQRQVNGISVLDPRVNHLPQHWRVEANVTIDPPNQINIPTRQYTDGEPIGVDPVMYSRLFPLHLDKDGNGNFGSISDLGYLSIGQPWRTIALYTKGGASGFNINPILDYFTVDPSVQVNRGRVNMNSRKRDVLAATYLDLPIASAPEYEPVITRINEGRALQIADALMAKTASAPFDRLSKIGDMPEIYSTTFMGELTDDGRVESLIRNVVNLMTVRQSYYGVILDAQVLSEDGIVTGSERALAIVWRDPTKINDVNETVVRYFTWLTE